MTDYQMQIFLKLIIEVIKANKDNVDEAIKILTEMLENTPSEE
jgi:hypothetical protein